MSLAYYCVSLIIAAKRRVRAMLEGTVKKKVVSERVEGAKGLRQVLGVSQSISGLARLLVPLQTGTEWEGGGC